MTPFLKQVALHYHPNPDISRMCFIFPNKRAVSFFRKYLGECAAAEHRPMIAPQCLTINDFFMSLGRLRPVDRVTRTVVLYDCYKQINPAAETLDDFLFWGAVLLNDFDEVDKYLVDPEHIFTNVSDIRRMQDRFEYMTPVQRKAMEHFLGQFEHGGEYKDRFRRIWDMLLPLYRNFTRTMRSKGYATEGMIYRDIADRMADEALSDMLSEQYPGTLKFVFTGLNALNECEKKVLRRMRDAHMAEFCWDFRSDEIRDPANRSSFFLTRNVEEFRPAFTTDPEGLGRPVINVVSVPSSVGQTKQLPAILSGTKGDIGTAIVLPDEGLLSSTLNSIPENIADINVTMGYPMKGSEFHALLGDIAALQLNLREKDGKQHFYHKYVWGIFSNGIFTALAGEEGQQKISKIRGDARYYIPDEDFAGNPMMEMVFRPAIDPAAYLKDLILGMVPLMKSREGMQMELQFAMYAYKAATRLADLAPQIRPRTWWKIFDQLVSGTAIPFDGEPLKGLQIMGPLETRALDFDNLIILSCNEGMFPRRAVSASFIPAELRKGFGLPTYEYQDAVWAYYFYRLMQRASQVWLLYDSRTELSRSGEESRYIRQLQMLYGFEIRRHVLKAEARAADAVAVIPKTPEDVQTLKAGRLSASSLQDYLSCPAKFYYSKIKGLRESDEVSESLDAGMTGSILHETMQSLYQGHSTVSRTYIKELLANSQRIRNLIRAGIMGKLHTDEVVGRNLIFEEIIFSYVKQVLRTDLELLKQSGKEEFAILGLEMEKHATIDGMRFVGFIDRIDSFDEGSVRIVDYKTGRVTDNDVKIDDGNAEAVVAKLFGSDNKSRPKIALQLYLYDVFMSGDAVCRGKRMENCIYQTTEIFRGLPGSYPRSEKFCALMKESLSGLLAEITDTHVSWRRTDDRDTCGYCDFKTICGR